MDRVRRIAVAATIACVALLGPLGPGMCVARAQDTGPERGPLAGVSGPLLETTVVGFRLQSRDSIFRRDIPDFEILVREDETRLLPLLRLLRLTKTQVAATDSTLRFHPEGAPETVINFRAGTIAIGTLSQSCPMVVGVSDVTSRPELYLPEEKFAEILPVEVQWVEESTQFVFKADRGFSAFRMDRSPSGLPSLSGQLGLESESLLPPAEVPRRMAPDLNFAHARLVLGLSRSREEDRWAGSLGPSEASLWAQVLGGSLTASLVPRRGTRLRGGGVELNRASWTTWAGNSEYSVGDQAFGISELTFPSVGMRGLRFNGVAGMDLRANERDLSELGRLRTFSSQETIEETAPLGTLVTLFFNDQEIETRQVEPSSDAPPGEGTVQFVVPDLFLNRLNEVRLVFQMPDGHQEETRREILGVNRLVPRGGLAYLGAVGDRTASVTSGGQAEGRLAGGRLLYGLGQRLTLGTSFAWQEGFMRSPTDSSEILYIRNPPLDRSTHTGLSAVWMLHDQAFLNVETGRSEGTGSAGRPDWGWKAGGDLYMGRWQIRPDVFRYGSYFRDGRDRSLNDCSGGRLHLLWRRTGTQLSLSGALIRDNLDGRLAQTSRIGWGETALSLRSWIPRTTASFRLNLLESSPLPSRRSGTLELSSSFFRGWNWRSSHTLASGPLKRRGSSGLERSLWDERTRLLTGLSSGWVGGSASPTDLLRLERTLGRKWTLAVEHRRSDSYRRTYFDLGHRGWDAGSLQTRLAVGYDWLQQSPFIQNRMELQLDRERRYSILIEHQQSRKDMSVGLYLQLDPLVGFFRNRPALQREGRVDPDFGGVKGKVFFDANANGLLDPGEPGVRDVEVITDTGRRVSSMADGRYVIAGDAQRYQYRVGLQTESLSALYTPTNAVQDARVRPGLFAEVNLGVTTLASISGRVLTSSGERSPEGVRGVRVFLADSSGSTVGNSVTASDGSYYLGDVRAGTYTVKVDPASLPQGTQLDTGEVKIEVRATERSLDIEDVDFRGQATPPAVRERSDSEPKPAKPTEYKVFDK